MAYYFMALYIRKRKKVFIYFACEKSAISWNLNVETKDKWKSNYKILTVLTEHVCTKLLKNKCTCRVWSEMSAE